MTDDTPRKTLSLKNSGPAATPAENPRKRSGARAKQVARQERRLQKKQPLTTPDRHERDAGDARTQGADAPPPRPRRRAPRMPARAEVFTVFAPCPQGPIGRASCRERGCQ